MNNISFWRIDAVSSRRDHSIGPDETYIKVKGKWYYLYRAVDKEGNTIDFLLTEKRDKKAAKGFLIKAIAQNGLPEKITIDKSGANKVAIEEYNKENETIIEIRQIKYLNNIVEQDHRGIKRITKPMMGFKSFDSGGRSLRRSYATAAGP